MKKWVKIEIDLMEDPRVKKVVFEHGLKGFGLLMAMMIAVRRNEGEQLPQSFLLYTPAVGCRYSVKLARKILLDYGLFVIENGMVRACVREGVRGLTSTGGRGSAGADPSADAGADPEADAPEHFLLRENRLETEEIIKKIAADDDVTVRVQRVRGWLCDDNNMPWREPVIMRSGCRLMLKAHWPEAVEFFIQHIMAQDKLSEMYNEHETRQYFANFARQGCKSGSSLAEHLRTVEAKQQWQKPKAGEENRLWI